MKIKKIMLITILLLAVLTIASASASENIQDENITASDETVLEETSTIEDVSSSDELDELNEDERKEVNYQITIPESVIMDYDDMWDDESTGILYEFWDYDVTGNFSILIDNKTYHTAPLKGYGDADDSYFELKNLDLNPGIHFVQVKYGGDENYLPFNHTGYYEYKYIEVKVPEPVNIGYWNDMQIETILAYNATGKLQVFIDNNILTTVDDVYAERRDYEDNYDSTILIDLTDYDDLTIGNHSYRIIYTSGNYPDKTFEGNFTVDYIFYVSNGKLENNDTIYMDEEIEVDIRVPDTTGTLVLNLNGRDYPIENDDDVFEYILPELQYGANNLTFTYTHPKYPQKQVNYTANVSGRISSNFEHDVYYNVGINNYSILLPANATGNLSVYKRGEYNYETGEYAFGDLIKTAKLVNGMASLCIDDMPIGDYEVIVTYTGSDYDIEDAYGYFTVYPNVIYPKGISTQSTQDHTVSVVSSSGLTGNITIGVYESEVSYDIDGDEYLVLGDLITELYNGSADENITRSIPELDVGVYFIEVKYIDESTISRNYQLTVRNVDTAWQMEFDIPTIINEYDSYIYYSPSNMPDDVDGLFELYIDDELVDSTNKEFGYDFYYNFYGESLTSGNHTWRVEFSKDSYYEPTSASGEFNYIEDSSDIDYDEIIIIYSNFYYNIDDDFFAAIYLPEDAGGNVKIIINDDTIFDDCIDRFAYDYGRFYVTVDSVAYDWQEDSYTITVIYDGEDYGTFNNTKDVDAYEYGVNIELYDIVDKNDEYGAIAYVEAPYDADGNIIVKINNAEYFNKAISDYGLDDWDSSFTIYLSDLTLQFDYGTYDIEVIYDGEDYKSNNPKSKLEVTYSMNAFIDNGHMDMDRYSLDYGEKYDFEIELPDDATGKLTVIFNGVNTPVSYNESGAKYSIDTTGMKLGNYTITAKYTGDSKYPDRTIDVDFTVIPYISIPYDISPKEHNSFIVTVPSDATGTLTLYKATYNINTEEYTYEKISSVDVKDGKASIMMPEITEDTEYKVEFTSGSYSRSFLAMVDVYSNSPEINVAVTPGEITVGENIQIQATSTVKGAIDIYVDGRYLTSVNFTNGVAAKTLDNLAVGQHMINIKYDGYYEDDDGDYMSTGKFYSNTFYVTVKNKPAPAPTPAPAPAKKTVKKDVIKLTLKKVKVKRSAKKLTLTATLKINGKAAKGKKLTFKFNGKKYTAKTNKKGVAKVTIKKKILKKLKKGKKVKYQVSYGKTTKKLTVKVAK